MSTPVAACGGKEVDTSAIKRHKLEICLRQMGGVGYFLRVVLTIPTHQAEVDFWHGNISTLTVNVALRTANNKKHKKAES